MRNSGKTIGHGMRLIVLLAAGKAVTAFYIRFLARPMFLRMRASGLYGHVGKLPVLVCRVLLTVLGLGLTVLIPAEADGQVTNPMAQIHTVDFPYCCPRPTWWDDVEMDRRIGTVGELSAVWQDQSLTKEQKAKAMFRAIEEFRLSNDDIVAPSITYFRSVAGSYSHLRELYEYGVATYIDFDRSLENYGGEVGDLSAGMVNTLAKLYLAEGEPERAVPILRYILEVREAEVNDHLLEFAALHLGNALNQTGRGPEAIEVLLAARRDYEGDWEARLDDQLVQVRGTMGLSYYLHDTRLSLPALGGALILALGGLIFWRRRRG